MADDRWNEWLEWNRKHPDTTPDCTCDCHAQGRDLHARMQSVTAETIASAIAAIEKGTA